MVRQRSTLAWQDGIQRIQHQWHAVLVDLGQVSQLSQNQASGPDLVDKRPQQPTIGLWQSLEEAFEAQPDAV
ncbi:hypothetical protein MKX08_010209 [Trichoderma sp. CBMAI-0020]|nr:hypothetical protein MKX08_010209 [Trichoderma sp. CBMAI-0020]